VKLTEGMLFVERVKVGDDWLWHDDRIDSKLELVTGCLGEFVTEIVKGKTENIGDETVLIALCDSLLWMMIVVEAGWSLAPSVSWIQGILGSLLCGG
jgi:hypothetical protein